MDELINRVVNLILNAKRIVVFTGAGVSTESGIPDFRSPGGIWGRYDPREFTFQRFVADPEVRRNSWKMLRSSGLLAGALPNMAHLAIAELERLGKLDCVITQNVDNLHQKAGNAEVRVIELHGTTRFAICLDCGKKYPMEEILKRLDDGIEIPECDECRGIVKSATISFGQQMPLREVTEAQRRSSMCDLFVVVGSSLEVYPAAYMPVYALEAGARLVIINLAPTPLDNQAEVVIHEKAGTVLSAIMAQVRKGLG